MTPKSRWHAFGLCNLGADFATQEKHPECGPNAHAKVEFLNSHFPIRGHAHSEGEPNLFCHDSLQLSSRFGNCPFAEIGSSHLVFAFPLHTARSRPAEGNLTPQVSYRCDQSE